MMSDECPTLDQLRELIRAGINSKRLKEATLFVDEIDRLRDKADALRAEIQVITELLEDEKRETALIREKYGAREDETFLAFVGRLFDDLEEARAKMATMVCGTCGGCGEVRRLQYENVEPCPVCQPKEGTL